MQAETVSILVPVYNAEAYLPELIRSVQAQTYPHWELVCVDDQSSDQSLRLLETASWRDPRIVVGQNPENLGPSATLNAAAGMARSELLFRLDADDTMQPRRLQRQVDFLRAHPNVGLLGCGYRNVDDRGKVRGNHISRIRDSEALRAKFVFTNAMGHSTVAYRRDCFARIGGYDENLRASLDYDFLARLSTVTECGYLPEALVNYRTHGTNITTTRRKAQRENAAEVQGYLLRYYGFRANDHQLQLHRQIGIEDFHGSSAEYAQFILGARGWLSELKGQNAELRVFDPQLFDRVLNEMHTTLYARASCSLKLRDYVRTFTPRFASLRPGHFAMQLAHSLKNGV